MCVAPRRKPVLGEDRAVERLLGHHHHVRVKAEDEPAPLRVPLQRRDHRHRALQQPLEDELEARERPDLVRELQQLVARAAHREHAVLAGDDRHLDRRIVLQAGKGVHQAL
jgi:hypothetical protein